MDVTLGSFPFHRCSEQRWEKPATSSSWCFMAPLLLQPKMLVFLPKWRFARAVVMGSWSLGDGCGCFSSPKSRVEDTCGLSPASHCPYGYLQSWASGKASKNLILCHFPNMALPNLSLLPPSSFSPLDDPWEIWRN